MASLLDYAALSAYVYGNARGNKNVTPLSSQWSEIAYAPGAGFNGFTAGAYQNGNDIVIAFKGTDTGISSLASAVGSADDVTSDLALAAGLGSTQLFQAALFYEQIKADPRYLGCNITFTGHSLGGGLASIMSAWFNRSATTFDEAPFEVSALNPVLMASVSAYLGLNGYSDSDFLNFIFTYPVTYGGREAQVTNYFVKGEFLESARAVWPTVLGADNPIAIGGGSSLNGLTLHSINLAAALLMQDKLRSDTVSLPNLLPAIFDETLYAKPLAGDERDFLTFLLNDQIKAGYTNANGLLARFATDLDKLTQYGANLKDSALGKSLIDIAIADYYFMQSGFTKDFFNAIGGGISFDLADIGTDGIRNKTAIQLDNTITQQLSLGLETRRFLAQDNYWSIQSGNTPLNATGTGSNNDAMIGGATGDALDGGAGADFLYGGDGADNLIGGAGGSDELYGGASDVARLPFMKGRRWRNGEHGLNSNNDLEWRMAAYRSWPNTIAGTETSVPMGSSTLSAEDRHTMTLLAAMQGNAAFKSVVQQLPNLATLLLDPALFGVTDRKTPGKTDLLSSLLRNQYGAEGVTADGRLERFAADMQQLLGTAGVVQTNAAVRDALMVASMEYFYTKAATTADKLFTTEGNGIHFKYSDIGAASYQSLPRLASAVESLLGTAAPSANARLVTKDAWHIQSGATGMNWTATGNNNDAMIGGATGDALDGGAADFLYGGDGGDTLTGGTGDDLLSGGAGYDTYLYASGDGWDWIDDSDGQGQILYDGMALTGGRRIADNVWQSADGKYTYSLFDHAENGTTDKALYIDGPTGGMLIKHWQNTQLGITLDDTATSPAADIVGTDDNDRLIGTAANQTLDGLGGHDILIGDDGAQTLVGDSGSDFLQGDSGSDFLQGGGGKDILAGGLDDDVLDGGAGSDVLNGDDGNDILFAGGGLDASISIWSSPDFAGFVTNNGGQPTLANAIGGDLIIADASDNILNGGTGNGAIYVDEVPLTGGAQYGHAKVHRDANGHTYTDAGHGNMVIGGSMLVMNWQAGNLGINMTGPLAPVGVANNDDYHLQRRAA